MGRICKQIIKTALILQLKMSDTEEMEQQPDSVGEHLEIEDHEDKIEDLETAEEELGSRKRKLIQFEEEQQDDAPSEKVPKEEISVAIICDKYSSALENIEQTETSIVYHLKVKVVEDLSLATIPNAVENIISEDTEVKTVVIVLPQDDLRHISIPLYCRLNNCDGKGLQHTQPLPINCLDTYMDSLKNTREELVKTYPDTDIYWVTPGPVDFKFINRKERCKKCKHYNTDDLWKSMTANYNKRFKVLVDEMPASVTINWFARACWQYKHNKGKREDYNMVRVLQGDLAPVREA